MSSWGGEGEAPRADRREATGPDDAADAGDAPGVGVGDAVDVVDTPDVGDASDVGDAVEVADTPDVGGASEVGDAAGVGEAMVGLGLWDGPVPGDDPLPSSGSLKWAPDPTEPLPSDPPVAPAGPSTPSAWPDPAQPSARWDRPGPGGPSVWSAPAHSPHSPRSAVPPGPSGPPGPATHLPRGPQRPGPGARRRWQSDRVLLGAFGTVVAIVAVATILVTRDGGGPDDPQGSATTSSSLVAGDGTGPAGPIVGPTGVIGSWSGSEWQPRPEGEQPGADLDYAVLGLTGAVSTARGEAVAEECAAQRATSEADVAVDLDAGDGPPQIAVAGVAEPRPRPVQPFGTDSAVYLQAAAEVAAGLGATGPATVSQVLRTDLDGSGTEEVVVAAGHVSDPEDLAPAAGDWSAVFLRRVVGDGVATDVLASSVAGGGGFDHIQVATVADLNGDGTMEVALDGRSSTGGWTSVHALDDDGGATEVLRAGCED